MKRSHDMPFGCQLDTVGKGHFRLWAPSARRVALEYRPPDGDWHSTDMQAQPDGWYNATVADCGAGSHYRFRIDGDSCVPDPASRFQPTGVHGPSEVIDSEAFDWQDGDWLGRPWEEAILYELHVGCFSPEGSYRGVEQRLQHLVELGVTAIELMPLAQAPGQRNWGYDGTYPFAPSQNYGKPEALKSLVQAAHQHGLMVFLDVVYNHFGPEGNYLHLYAPAFFTDRYHTPWGQAINFDGDSSDIVRRFFIDNALYWLKEYHIDGLRLDAVHAICDRSQPDILQELADDVRAHLPPNRHVHLVLENDHNAAHYLKPRERYDAQWNDDSHHALHVLLTGEQGGYYADYADNPAQHLGRCLGEGFAYQGEYSPYRENARGEPSRSLPCAAFVNFLQNHDQIGNRAFGERLTGLSGEEALRAAVAILLLAPAPPLLFMGEEWGAEQPFLFFCDFGDELADAVREGRRREFARFPAFRDERARERIPDPNALATFEQSRLDWKQITQPEHHGWLIYYRRLLAIRKRDILPLLSRLRGEDTELTVDDCLQLRWHTDDGTQLTLLANMSPEPVAAGMEQNASRLLFSTSAINGSPRHPAPLPPWHVSWYLQHPDAYHASR